MAVTAELLLESVDSCLSAGKEAEEDNVEAAALAVDQLKKLEGLKVS
jgi:hypothetical protein